MERACLENVVADLGLPTVCHVSVHFMEMSSLSGGSVDYGQQDSEGNRSLSKYADFVEWKSNNGAAKMIFWLIY